MKGRKRITDKERLDWLETYANTLEMDDYGKWLVVHCDDEGRTHKTVRDGLRSTINAALRASRRKGGGRK